MNNHDGDSTQAQSSYRIGAVARLTGITPNTLRAWERRYGLVTPSRSGSATRLYSAGDIERLTLVKRLVDDGNAIGSVAGLALEQLRERIKGLPPPAAEAGPERPCRVLVLGSTLADRLAAKGDVLPDPALELVGIYREPGPFLAEAQDLAADLVVLEYASIHAEDIREIGSLVARSGAARALVVYAFATRATLERLESPNLVPLRGPIDRNLLRRWCLALHARPLVRSAWTLDPDIDLSRPLPPRRFEPSALAAIAAAAVTVRCECPHHLVDLIGGLAAFETYSQECEIRNVEDAALHAFLHAVTAQARSLLETALARVVEVDGIALP
jgi:MerR family transcriptional regulator, light-induced transcriptional regulator